MALNKFINLSRGERVALSALSAITAFVNPERGDAVATLGETTGAVFWLDTAVVSCLAPDCRLVCPDEDAEQDAAGSSWTVNP